MKFIKLLRPINLLIIVFTMIGGAYHMSSTNYFQFIRFNAFDFGLLIFSTLLIAGAGNIINDYFDIKADRINKPKKIIIGKYIKKRWAILIHWLFNGLAVIISIYLSVKYHSLWFVFIYILTGNFLWYYSLKLKKRVVIGNLIIALMTALIPILVIQFFKVSNESNELFSPFHSTTWGIDLNYNLLYLLAVCALITNIAREIIKDIQDMKGDQEIRVRSLPMLIGKLKAYWIAAIIAQLSLVSCTISYVFFSEAFPISKQAWAILFVSASLNILLVLIPLVRKPTMKRCSLLLKISLFIGICSLYFS
jgi:4-hydroxybenzoate polyprenyltransferase